MLNRMSLDLGVARHEKSIAMKRWRYLFVGACTGTVTLKLGSTHASALNPSEFARLKKIENYKYMFLTNTAQADKVLNIYFDEEESEEEEEIGNY